MDGVNIETELQDQKSIYTHLQKHAVKAAQEHIVLRGFVCYRDQSALLTRIRDVMYSTLGLPFLQHQKQKNTGLYIRNESVVVWMDELIFIKNILTQFACPCDELHSYKHISNGPLEQ